MKIPNRFQQFKDSWNAFDNVEETRKLAFALNSSDYGYGRPSFAGYSYGHGSILDTVMTRFAIDVSLVDFRHYIKDNDTQTDLEMDSGLNRIFKLEANIDQNAIAFMRALVYSLLEEGEIAAFGTNSDGTPNGDETADIQSMRIGRIVSYKQESVDIIAWNAKTGTESIVTVLKRNCFILQNPLFPIMNGENSTLRRLSRKLALLDKYDEDSMNPKLDLILQMPFPVKGEQRVAEAKRRVDEIRDQLANSAYGIAYIDTNEHITQLNRSVNNNLLPEIKELTEELFNQLGFTQNIFNGTANETELKSYYNRTLTPLCKEIAMEFDRKFISDEERTAGQYISYALDPFRLAPLDQLASSVQTFKSNAILTTNECRAIMGFPKIDDPSADILYNPNTMGGDALMDMQGGDQGEYVEDYEGDEVEAEEQ